MPNVTALLRSGTGVKGKMESINEYFDAPFLSRANGIYEKYRDKVAINIKDKISMLKR